MSAVNGRTIVPTAIFQMKSNEWAQRCAARCKLTTSLTERPVAYGTQLVQRLKQVRVEYLGPIAAVEALDIGVLIRLARLDVLDGHAVFGNHSTKGCAVS